MILILGLVILVAAVVVGVGGVLGNGGQAHQITHGFALFGYHVTGSTGTLFLYGIVVGAIAVFGLSVLLAGARRTSRRGRTARRTLQQSRRETAAVSQDRDDMISQRDSARAETASALENSTPPTDDHQVSPEVSSEASPEVSSEDDHRSRWQRLGHRAAPEQATDTGSAAPADQAAPEVPVPAE
jgi:uncharacterized membrane protein YciS (DUF1049 family)